MPYTCSITKNGIAVHEEGADHHLQYVFYVSYDDVTNRVTLEIRDIAGNVVLSVVETAGDPTMTGKLVDMLMAAIAGLDWQESVLQRLAAPPMGPALGARYLATATAGGWTVDHIYQWDGAAYVDTTPNEGMCVFVEDENTFYRFADAVWVTFFNITDLKAGSVGLTASADPETLAKTTEMAPAATTVQDLLNALVVNLGCIHYTALDLLATPPVPALDGDTYAVDAGAGGAWAGKDGQLAVAVFVMGAFDHWDYIPLRGGEMVAVGTPPYIIVNTGGTTWGQLHALIADPVPTDANEVWMRAQKLSGVPSDLGDATLRIVQYMNNVGAVQVLDWTSVVPGAPADGDTYAVAAGAAGLWAGQDGHFAVAVHVMGVFDHWDFFTGKGGDMVLVAGSPGYLIVYTGGPDFAEFGAVVRAGGIALLDAGGYFTLDDVESALQELAQDVNVGAFIPTILSISNAPAVPGSDGDAYVVGPAGAGAWAGHDNEIAIAVFVMGALDHWDFQGTSDGHMVFRADTSQVYIKDWTTHVYVPAAEMFVSVDAIYWEYDVDGVLRWVTGMAEQMRNQGHIGKAVWTPANNPSDADEVGIGTDNYVFKTVIAEQNDPPMAPAGGDKYLCGSAPTDAWAGHPNAVATYNDPPGSWSFDDPAANHIYVAIGAATVNSLVNISTKIHSNGTQNVNSASDAVALTIKSALAAGGIDYCGVLPAVTATEVGDPWVVYAPGKAVGGRHTIGEVPLTTANIAAAFDIDLDFTPTWCKFWVYDASGVPQALDSASMVVGASKVTFDPDNDCADTDVLVFEAGN